MSGPAEGRRDSHPGEGGGVGAAPGGESPPPGGATGALLRLRQELESAPDFDHALRLAVRALTEAGVGALRAFALGPDGKGLRLQGRAASAPGAGDQLPEFTSQVRSLSLPLLEGADPVVGAFLSARCRHEPTWAAAPPPWTAWGVEGLAAVPIWIDGRAAAVLAVEPDDGFERRPLAAHLLLVAGLVEGAGLRLLLSSRLRQRDHEGALLHEMSRATLSAMNIREGVNRVTRVACQALNARGSALWVMDAREGSARLEGTYGAAAQRERLARGLTPLATACMASGRREVVESPASDSRLAADAAAAIGSVACVPLVAYEEVRGALAVYDLFPRPGAERDGVSSNDLLFLELLADQAAVMLAYVELYDRIRQGEKRLEDARSYQRHLERLASVGERAARAAQDARHPLASIGGFARRVQRELDEANPLREYLEVIVRETERLERLLSEQLQFASLPRPHWKLEGLNQVVQDSLQELSEELVRKRIRLLKKLSPELPPLLIDAEKIRQVVGNILRHALQSLPAGGRLRVESRPLQRYVMVEIAHDGPRIPGNLAEQLFVPFAMARANAPAVGLSVARQIVQRHGGEIRLRSDGEWGVVFSFTLPIQENQDRRARDLDRRQEGTDRRNRFPLA